MKKNSSKKSSKQTETSSTHSGGEVSPRSMDDVSRDSTAPQQVTISAANTCSSSGTAAPKVDVVKTKAVKVYVRRTGGENYLKWTEFRVSRSDASTDMATFENYFQMTNLWFELCMFGEGTGQVVSPATFVDGERFIVHGIPISQSK